MPTETTRLHVDRIARAFQTISPQSLDEIAGLYAEQARFKDPFNDVRGPAAIRRIFEHMFSAVNGPRFVVTESLVDGLQAVLIWEFRFRLRRFDTESEQVILGSSHLRLNGQGLVIEHRDYWDAAEELYEKLPGLGALMRWLKRRAGR